MPINSRAKGARAERAWRDQLRHAGFTARRGQQFSGGTDSPDVVCEELDWLHPEVKNVERLNIHDAMSQAIRDAGEKIPYVAHKKNNHGWLVTMRGDDFLDMVRELIDARA